MSIKGNITKIQRGPALKLIYAITFKGESEIITREHEIDDVARIRFKYKSVITGNKPKFIFHLSSVKHDTAKDSTIKMNVSSEMLKYSKEVTCPEVWSDWQHMGDKDPNAFDAVSAIYFIPIEISIIVWKVGTDTFPKLHKDTDFTDFHLSTSDGSVAVHKACLVCHSDVFKTMLAGDWKETTEGTLTVEGVTLQTLQDLKDYMYLGVLPDEGLQPLLLIAKCYMIENLEAECIRKLAQTTSAENLFTLFEFACEHNIPELAFAIAKITPDAVINNAHKLKKQEDSVLKLNTNQSWS